MVYLQCWHGWCHKKLLPSWCVLCTPYNHAPCHFYHPEADSQLQSFSRSNSPQKSQLSSPSSLRSGHSPGISWHEQTSDWTIPRPAHSSFCSASRRRGNTGEWASPLLPAVHESLTLPEYTEEGKKIKIK